MFATATASMMVLSQCCAACSASMSVCLSRCVWSTRPSRSDLKQVGEPAAMVAGGAEHQAVGLGPFEVQVGRVLPGEADAAVHLDVLRGAVQERVSAPRFGQRRGQRQLGARAANGDAACIGGGGPGRLDGQQHVGTLVLDRLEAADGAPE